MEVKLSLSANVFNVLNRQDTYVRTSVKGTPIPDASPALLTSNSICWQPQPDPAACAPGLLAGPPRLFSRG